MYFVTSAAPMSAPLKSSKPVRFCSCPAIKHSNEANTNAKSALSIKSEYEVNQKAGVIARRLAAASAFLTNRFPKKYGIKTDQRKNQRAAARSFHTASPQTLITAARK